ncbi:hypothetical protein RB608_19440 [Nocardioides sp. LHD-245]|uniref:hypothetical protein n=1 Tax=Nocardioides sp. LHD-245 TaxID=3051387 RepID=UPI0027DFC208|nr:hypothetical protein [Nocardioides sp. LHD-245]
MDMGVHPDERALLEALIAAAAPDPLPADQAIPLLCRVEETEVADLGRLAYRALTGVDPGTAGTPPSPAELVPGFPSFAAEVIQRAIAGPEERRPTIQGLLVVLETVGPALWPTSGRPHVVIGEDGPVPADDPAASDDLARAEERQRVHAEFRSLLIPTREVPRFDPLFDTLSDPLGDPVPEDDAEPDAEGAAEPDVEGAAGPAVEAPEESADESAGEPLDEHDAFRRVVATGHTVPRFDPLDGAGDVPGLGTEIVRRRRSKRRRSASHSTRPRPVAPAAEDVEAIEDELEVLDPDDIEFEIAEPAPDVPDDVQPEIVEPTPARPEVEPEAVTPAPARAPAGGADKRETLILVAVVAVLILLGAIYAAAQKSDRPHDSGTPQGASLVTSQPVAVRA